MLIITFVNSKSKLPENDSYLCPYIAAKTFVRIIYFELNNSYWRSPTAHSCHFQILVKIKTWCGQTLDLHAYHIKLARLIQVVFSFDISLTFTWKLSPRAFRDMSFT